ncbi:MAG: DegT/DnrJ/EryC1/StrS family aminotransferase, partial [Pseudomonadota bacterium]
HATAFPYGRTGQMLLMEALGLKDREIILPAYTCVVVAHAIVKSGNKPVFIDSEPDGFNMDLDLAEAAINDRTGAIIATSIHGYPVDLDRLDALITRHPDVHIIQDCAHSFMANWKGRSVQEAGIAAIFGLNVSKLMTSVFGGMITTADARLNERLRTIRDSRLERLGSLAELKKVAYILASNAALTPMAFSMVKVIQKMGLIDRFVRYYDEAQIDMPQDHLRAMGSVAASVGVSQCQRYPETVKRRQRLAKLYHSLLSDVPGIEMFPLVDGATYSHFVLQVDQPDRLVAACEKQGVELGRVIDYCLPDMESYTSYISHSDFPRTRALNAHVINCPSDVTDNQARRVADVIRANMAAATK